MPAKFIVIGVVFAVTITITAYENRDQLKELFDRSRRKLAISLHQLADKVEASRSHNNNTEQIPLRGRSENQPPKQPDKKPEQEPEEQEPEHQQEGAAEASGTNAQELGEFLGLRHRGDHSAARRRGSELLFDSSEGQDVTMSRRSSTVTLQVSEHAPAPPPENPLDDTGYETQRTQEQEGHHSSSSSEHEHEHAFENSAAMWSAHEWDLGSTTSSQHNRSASPSLAGSAAEEVDAISDVVSVVDSVDSWTELGSEVSDSEH